MGNNKSHFKDAKLQSNEHGVHVRTTDLKTQVKHLRKAGYKIEAISWPINKKQIIIWFYWLGTRPTRKLPTGSFVATLGWGEKIIKVPKTKQISTIKKLEKEGFQILAVDYDDKGIGRIWFH